MTHRYRTLVILAIALASLPVVEVASAATKARQPRQKRDFRTMIEVKDIHCPACAKKLSQKLQAIPGVASAKVDAKKGIAIVAPKSTAKLPSPRAQWEAIEKAGYKPVKLHGPFGKFTKKPDAKFGKKPTEKVSSKTVRNRG